ncbi:septum formation family protein [Corynebacterium gerontici]|uniref:Putative membrane protein n=1 Tax=Corynebacterium gerontici TaxID=2079234 RepID=A0A3G6J0M8_9CORY|nr:septum formation family protein [Corynebacterium gerontici]AZA10508.1 putative membrane protein [Corynebacterium gerontici]
MNQSWRSASAARALLVGALIACAGLGAYEAGSEPTPMKQVETKQAASFTTADVGACLTWTDKDGQVADFEQTDCASPHRFEVSSREDLATYPAAEFGPDAQRPDLTRQAQLREELCFNPTVAYLGGTYDPNGKYSIAPILPPQESWDAGDRTLLCGVQSTDDSGNVLSTTGKAAEQDQANVFEVGQCVATDAAGGAHAVDCKDPHQLEMTAVVDLAPVFPDRVPNPEEQDKHLRTACTQAARDYLGSDDRLYESTLQPFWTTVPSNSWLAGSHSVNCALVFGDQGKFATLQGSAKDQFTINGQPPAQRPKRAPIVNPDELQKVEQ